VFGKGGRACKVFAGTAPAPVFAEAGCARRGASRVILARPRRTNFHCRQELFDELLQECGKAAAVKSGLAITCGDGRGSD